MLDDVGTIDGKNRSWFSGNEHVIIRSARIPPYSSRFFLSAPIALPYTEQYWRDAVESCFKVRCQAHFEYEISRLLLSCDTFLDERSVPFCLKTQGSHLVCNLLMILAVVCYSDEVQISLAPGAGDCKRTQRHRIAASRLPKTTTTTLSLLLFRRPRTTPSFHSIHKDWLTPSNSKCCAPVPISILRILRN